MLIDRSRQVVAVGLRALLRLVRRLAYLLAGTWLLITVLMYFMQRHLMYIPQERGIETALLRLPSDAGEQLVAVQERAGDEALIYFGGNAEDVSYTLGELAVQFPDRAIYLPHYRGYGGSAGEPSQAALTADALALFDHVQKQHARISVIGRSLGSGVAMQLAGVRPVARLVLVTPFDSMASVAGQHYPWLPVRLLLKDHFDSAAIASKVKAPCLVLLAGLDRVIPLESSQQLIASFAQQPRVHAFPEADHNDISGMPTYYPALKSFLADSSHGKDSHVFTPTNQPVLIRKE
jgi:fermentation-respiration switch protein FrsA (DUF1100 family)